LPHGVCDGLQTGAKAETEAYALGFKKAVIVNEKWLTS